MFEYFLAELVFTCFNVFFVFLMALTISYRKKVCQFCTRFCFVIPNVVSVFSLCLLSLFEWVLLILKFEHVLASTPAFSLLDAQTLFFHLLEWAFLTGFFWFHSESAWAASIIECFCKLNLAIGFMCSHYLPCYFSFILF